MSDLRTANLTIQHFEHTKEYQHIRPKADKLMPVQEFLNKLVGAPSIEEAHIRLSSDTSSWDYYTNWMDGQREIAITLAANKSFLAKLPKADPTISKYLLGVSLAQRLIQINVDFEKYPIYSTKWQKALELYQATYSKLLEFDPDYKGLIPERPDSTDLTIAPFVEKLAENGHYLALTYTAFSHIKESDNESLPSEKRDQHFKTGFALLDKACVKGMTETIIKMGEIYERLFHEVNHDAKTSEKMYMNMIKHYDLATRRGDPNARARLGNCLLNPRTLYDFKTQRFHGATAQVAPGLLFLGQSAKEDTTMAFYYLGKYYTSIEKFEQAIEQFEKAADNEHLDSMNELEKLYFKKIHHSKPQIASQFKVKAAENRYRMGRLYEIGHCPSGKSEYKTAQVHYIKAMAMELGLDPSPQIKAALALSRLAREGKTTPTPNAPLSIMYLKKAADMGDTTSTLVVACFSLFPQDTGLKADLTQGRFYLNKLKKSKHPFDEVDRRLMHETLQHLIKQTRGFRHPSAKDESNSQLELHELIYDLSKLASNSAITIAACKSIGFLYAYIMPNKILSLTYYEQALNMGDLHAYIDIGLLSLDDNDPELLPNIQHAMEAFKAAARSGIHFSDDLILRIASQLLFLKKQDHLRDAASKALRNDIKFLRGYNQIERPSPSGTGPNNEQTLQISSASPSLQNGKVFSADPQNNPLSDFKRSCSN